MLKNTEPSVENRVLHRTMVQLPPRVHDALKRAALEEGESAAAIMRRALRRELGDRLASPAIETR